MGKRIETVRTIHSIFIVYIFILLYTIQFIVFIITVKNQNPYCKDMVGQFICVIVQRIIALWSTFKKSTEWRLKQPIRETYPITVTKPIHHTGVSGRKFLYSFNFFFFKWQILWKQNSKSSSEILKSKIANIWFLSFTILSKVAKLNSVYMYTFFVWGIRSDDALIIFYSIIKTWWNVLWIFFIEVWTRSFLTHL